MISKKSSAFDKPLKVRAEINLSTFSFLFSEIISYYAEKDRDKLEENLEKLGHSLGPRVLELVFLKEKLTKRENKPLEFLKLVHSSVWRILFGKTADQLEKLGADTYVLYENNPLYLKYIPPAESGQKGFTYPRFVGGIIKGMLDYSGLDATVETQTPPNDGKSKYPKTAFVVTFSEEAMKRENVK